VGEGFWIGMAGESSQRRPAREDFDESLAEEGSDESPTEEGWQRRCG